MRSLLVLVLLTLTLPVLAQSNPEQDQRMNWWREARFGLFIHWGLYSIPAGKWGNETGHAEWIRETAHIPVKEYEQFQPQFNPTKFDAAKWVALAKNAGMKYIVITTKHHDGFNLFRSKYTDWDVSHTPFQRDIMKEMADATRAAGLHIGFYHSIMDWHEPDYLPRRTWEQKDRPDDGAQFSRYEKYLHNEVSQLLTDYGPVGVMWFDGQWESTWNSKRGKSLFDLCRKLSPETIVNDRVSSGLPHIGDYTTPEQYIPDTGIPGEDWETCMTMNDHWGYNAADHDWKSSKDLIRNLVDIASKGGNYLLNVGPMSDGEFPPEAIERLNDIGNWMHVNSDSIYNTTASVFEGLPWGRSTTKLEAGKTVLYLQVFDWPKDGHLVVPSIANTPVSARLLGGGDLTATRDDQNIVVDVPSQAPSDICSVVELTVSGAPVVYKAPKINLISDVLVNPMTATITPGSEHLDVRYTVDGSDPTASSPLYSGAIPLSNTATIKAASFANGHIVSAVVSATVTKVAPWPAAQVDQTKSGWSCQEFKGDWDTMPDFNILSARTSFVASKLDVPKIKEIAEEYVGRVYTGYINAPNDDVYDFGLTSDDGSRLWIDGKLVVDNDGLHSAAKKNGVAPLAKGKHAVRVEWFNKTGDAALSVDWGKAGEKSKALSARSMSH